MSAKAWEARRTKKGLAVRCYPRIDKAMKRDKDKPLPRTYRGRLPGGGTLTVTLSPPEPDWIDLHPDCIWADCEEVH